MINRFEFGADKKKGGGGKVHGSVAEMEGRIMTGESFIWWGQKTEGER